MSSLCQNKKKWLLCTYVRSDRIQVRDPHLRYQDCSIQRGMRSQQKKEHNFGFWFWRCLNIQSKQSKDDVQCVSIQSSITNLGAITQTKGELSLCLNIDLTRVSGKLFRRYWSGYSGVTDLVPDYHYVNHRIKIFSQRQQKVTAILTCMSLHLPLFQPVEKGSEETLNRQEDNNKIWLFVCFFVANWQKKLFSLFTCVWL